MSFKFSNISANIESIKFETKKNAPAILTIAGVAGLCVTAYSAYQARKRIERIVDEVEADQAEGIEHHPAHVAGRVALAVAPTVAVGALSIAAITGSYKILTNRVNVLTTAVGVYARENSRLRDQVRLHAPEALAPVEDEREILENPEDEGKKNAKKLIVVSPKDVSAIEGCWFTESGEFYKDDHLLNQTFITTKANMLSNKLSNTTLNPSGVITLNEVYAALDIAEGVDKKTGALLGWTSNDYFDLEQQTVMVADEDGHSYPAIYVSWPAPHSIYDQANYGDDLHKYAY